MQSGLLFESKECYCSEDFMNRHNSCIFANNSALKTDIVHAVVGT